MTFGWVLSQKVFLGGGGGRDQDGKLVFIKLTAIIVNIFALKPEQTVHIMLLSFVASVNIY